MATHFVGAGAPDSPLEVTRFEFTIKSCRCTKTSEGVGTSDFCKAEIEPLPYNSEIITNSEHGRPKVAPTYIRDSLSCRKIAPLFADFTLCRRIVKRCRFNSPISLLSDI